MSSIVCSNMSFAFPDGTPLFTDLSFTEIGVQRTLRLSAGRLDPS
ncbi:MAG TPA: hypothetical protein VGA66_01990 [Mycobacterium sp.]